MDTEPFDVLRNYGWLRTMNTEPFAVVRNYRWFGTINIEPFKSASLRNPDDRESSTSQISLIFLYVIGSSEVSTR